MTHLKALNLIFMLVFPLFTMSACTRANNAGNYIGYVEAEYVYVAAPQSGWLTTLNVREGDSVSVQTALFELDTDQQNAIVDDAAGRLAQAEAQLRNIATGARPAEIQALEAQLAEAKARLVQAKSERNRWLPLVAEGNASKARGDQVKADYAAALARVKAAEEAIEIANLAGRDAAQDAAAAAVASAKAGLAEAEWRRDQRLVMAKISGRVEEIYRRQGEFVNAGAPVVSVLPTNALKVRFFVPQSALPELSIGAQVDVKPDGLDAPLPATISFIATEAEFTPPVIYSVGSREKLVFMVEARLADDSKLRPGLPVDVKLP